MEPNAVPRFVLSLVDTHTIEQSPDGDVYLQVNIAADKISDFNRLLPKAKRTNTVRTEYQAMCAFMKKRSDEMHKELKEVETKPLSEPEV